MTKAYKFSATSGEYLGEIAARPDPLDDSPMVPASTTLDAPPETRANEAAVWADDVWTTKPDHRGAEYWLADGSHHTIAEIGVAPPEDALDVKPPESREAQRIAALARVDSEHAGFLMALTGEATGAERDTWKPKEEAARAYLAGTALPSQTAMLSAEAKGGGITQSALAQRIVAKADAFLALIGTAGALRAKAQAAVQTATDDTVSLDLVAARVATLVVIIVNVSGSSAKRIGGERRLPRWIAKNGWRSWTF